MSPNGVSKEGHSGQLVKNVLPDGRGANDALIVRYTLCVTIFRQGPEELIQALENAGR